MLLSQLIFSSTLLLFIVLIHILYCIVLYYSDLEHFCGFYAIQNKLSIINKECRLRGLSVTIDLFRGACAVKGNVQVAGHVKPAPFSRRDVTLGDVDGSLFHIKI